MPDLRDGETTEMQGSGSKPYVLKNTGGVYSCSCPAWRNQSIPIEKRTCKHLRKFRGDTAEETRVGGAFPQRPVKSGSEDGEEAAGPPLLLAESWDNATDLTDWWMSEKLDGVRAYWDGKQFLSRQGNLYHAPDWFVDGLPAVPLDGELWIDRKKFQRTVSIVRRQDKSDLWNEVRFLIFDAPSASGGFEERLTFLQETLAKGASKFARQHAHERCKSLETLRAELTRIESLGGEGLMLRQPGSNYVAGRSATLLKVKTFHDTEATVIGHQPGAGRHKGRLGALLVRLPDGTEFAIGTGFSDRERENPPAVGSTVTFRYQELSETGVPRFPSWVGVRPDAPSKAMEPIADACEPITDSPAIDVFRFERFFLENPRKTCEQPFLHNYADILPKR
jgi:DNA ligase-1